jgi:hypothetical protein
VAERITHCPKGHEYAVGNVKWIRRPGGALHRRCRQCFNDDRNARRARARADG